MEVRDLTRARRLGVAAVLLAAALLAPAASGAQPGTPREIGPPTMEKPHSIPGGFDLPSGWRITPSGEVLAKTGDWLLNVTQAPDGRAVIGLHSGYTEHGLTVVDPTTGKTVQEVKLLSSWLGLAWSPDGKTLYVSGGNAGGDSHPTARAPIYAFSYADGRLSDQPVARFEDTERPVYWSGVARHPTRPLLYAANRGVDEKPSYVAVFDADSRQLITRIPVEASPYEVVLSKDGSRLFVSNWSSNSVSVIDTATNTVISTIRVGANPNDMAISPDGRLFVVCSNDNTVHVIDTRRLEVVERLSTTLTPLAPEGSTPDAVTVDAARKLLFVANADNNDVMVVDIADPAHSVVKGFIPTAWYPSALALDRTGAQLYLGAAKGRAAYPDIHGPESPLSKTGWDGDESIKTLQASTLERLPLGPLLARLPALTRQTLENSPYRDELLSHARTAKAPSVIPSVVGAVSPIQHVIYIIKENRTYDQVFGDLSKGDGDARLTIFGRNVTPNHHALAEQFVLFDNLYADGEVSVDGHSWSNSAYATDYNEKSWPTNYGGHSVLNPAAAYIPAAGHLWDLARRKGLTYRSYGEYAARVSNGAKMEAVNGVDGLVGHVSPDYFGFGTRDADNMTVFLKEFDGFEANFDSPDPTKRLPNYVVMSLPEDHTRGTAPGAFTPVAMVADNDQALGRLVDRVSHSRYWASTAIFVIEDDAQDGPDHVDARRTVALAISPYIRRATVDSTLYTTSSFIRTMELLLGLPPMSQFDAAANPLYASFGDKPDLTPFTLLPPQVDLMARNTVTAYGAKASARMDFSDNDLAPMHELNEIIWRSVKGADSPMPAPVHRYQPLIDANAGDARGRVDRND
ncbi:MAG: bifunctional YncE family protein/alkaline phosphatase family protein [Caulobacterales bacterium]